MLECPNNLIHSVIYIWLALDVCNFIIVEIQSTLLQIKTQIGTWRTHIVTCRCNVNIRKHGILNFIPWIWHYTFQVAECCSLLEKSNFLRSMANLKQKCWRTLFVCIQAWNKTACKMRQVKVTINYMYIHTDSLYLQQNNNDLPNEWTWKHHRLSKINLGLFQK